MPFFTLQKRIRMSAIIPFVKGNNYELYFVNNLNFHALNKVWFYPNFNSDKNTQKQHLK